MQTSPCTHSIWVEKSIEVIGMGRYQWSLFTICGLGWVADTMWIQAFVVCLPAIQAEWGLQSSDTGGLLTCLFGGMILGALIWGTFSDVFGRKPTFNITLFITAVFGLASAFSQSFVGVCCLAALLGCGLGGNLPVDSTMLLEFVPSYRKNIVTLLAIFWPVGSLVGAGVGWALLPPFSCPLSGGGGECDPAQNRGWRYVLLTMGLLTSIFFLLRILLFRFHESPRFLVSVGKYEQAQEILQILAAKNGVQLPTLEIMDFSSTSTHACTSKIVSTDLEGNTQHHYSQEQHQQHPHPHQFKSVSSYSIINHLKPLFSGGLFKITILLWLIWILLAIGYNIFNGFLPKLLMENSVELSYQDTYRNVFIITSCGVPGCIFSTFLAGSRTGKRNPMAISSLLAAGAMLVFTLIKSSDGQLIASCVASVFQNLFFSLLYAYTPEVYPPSVRGIGFGAASALNRLFGCLAPLIGGFMLNFELALPIQISAATIALATVFMFFLPRDST